jgi:hypothetical protein
MPGGQGGRALESVRAGCESPEFAVIRCVDWLQRRGEAVNQELWDGIYDIATTAKNLRTRLRARQMLVDRIDPIKRDAITVNAPVVVTWREPPPASLSSSSRLPLSAPSTSDSDDSTSSSATADSAKRFWL